MIPGIVANQITAQPAAKTATPTVGTPYCQADFTYNYLFVSVTNNDNTAVTIYRDGVNVGTIAANSIATITLYSGFNTPYSYNYNITAQASGKTLSDPVNVSGTVTLCFAM